MNTIVQPFSFYAFGDPLGKTPYVGHSSTAKQRDFEFHLQQMEKGGHDTGYQKAFNFGFKQTAEETLRKKRLFWDEFWRILLQKVFDFEQLYIFAVDTLQAAEDALQAAHEQITEEITEIENLETRLDARIEKYGSTSILRRLKRRLMRDRLELEEQHDELHDFERETLDPMREDLVNKKTLTYKKLLGMLGNVAATIPVLLMSPFMHYLEARERKRTQEAAEKYTQEPPRGHYSAYWNEMNSDHAGVEEEPEPVY